MDNLRKLNLLFLEDNEEFAKNTTEFLSIYFKKIFHCTNIKDALIAIADNRVDVIISDIIIEYENGLDFIQRIRRIDNTIPIVILSAHKNEEFLLKAIPLNITSYQLKPFRYHDFISLLKKLSSIFDPGEMVVICDCLTYDYKTKELSHNDTSIKLTKKEMLFIELLIKNDTSITSTELIQRDIWESKVMSDAAIKNLIFRLRKKVDIDFISTVQGVGYKLTNPVSS